MIDIQKDNLFYDLMYPPQKSVELIPLSSEVKTELWFNGSDFDALAKILKDMVGNPEGEFKGAYIPLPDYVRTIPALPKKDVAETHQIRFQIRNEQGKHPIHMIQYLVKPIPQRLVNSVLSCLFNGDEKSILAEYVRECQKSGDTFQTVFWRTDCDPIPKIYLDWGAAQDRTPYKKVKLSFEQTWATIHLVESVK